MNKSSLIKNLLRVLSTKKEANDAINEIISSISASLKRKEKVVISGLGSFYVKLSPARKFRIPKTNKIITAPAKTRIKFIPSKNLV